MHNINKHLEVKFIGQLTMTMSAKSSLEAEIQSNNLTDQGMMDRLKKLNSDMAEFINKLPLDKKKDLLRIDRIARNVDDSMDSQLNGLSMPVVSNVTSDQLAEALTVMLLHSGYINSVEELSTVKLDDLRNGQFASQFANKVAAGQEDLAAGDSGIEADDLANNLKRVLMTQNPKAKETKSAAANQDENKQATTEELDTSNKPQTAQALASTTKPGFWNKPIFNATQYMANTELKGAVKMVQDALTPANIAIGAAAAVTFPIWGAKAVALTGLATAVGGFFVAKGAYDWWTTGRKLKKQKALLNGDPSEEEKAKIQKKIGELRVAKGEAMASVATLGISGAYLKFAALKSKLLKGGQTQKFADYLSKKKTKLFGFIGKTRVQQVEALKNKQAGIESTVRIPDVVKHEGVKTKKEATVALEKAKDEYLKLSNDIAAAGTPRTRQARNELQKLIRQKDKAEKAIDGWTDYLTRPRADIIAFEDWHKHEKKIKKLVKAARKEFDKLKKPQATSRVGRAGERFRRRTTGEKTPQQQNADMEALQKEFEKGDAAATDRLRELATPRIDVGIRRRAQVGVATLPFSEAYSTLDESLE